VSRRTCHADAVSSGHTIRAVLAPLRGLLGPDAAGTRESLVALGVSSVTATGAGVALAAISGTLTDLPGLLVLVPAAIGMRGNIFGALGSRLSTTIHTGAFTMARRADTIVGQNVLASIVLTLATSLMLGVLAKLVADASGLDDTIGVADLVVISVVGGALASVVVLGVTLALAAGSAHKGWDLDNVNAPLVSAVGDVVTLPALFFATVLVGIDTVTPVLAGLFAIVAIGSAIVGLRSRLEVLVLVLRESLPILAVTGVVLALAGVVIEHRLEAFSREPALLVLVPSALGGAGAIGGILSSRLSSKLHLGVISARSVPERSARRDIVVAAAIGFPINLLNGILAFLASVVFGIDGPGVVALVGVSLVGGSLATVFVVLIAYYGTVSAVRFGVDPDTYGIPIVTSTVDLVGAYTLVLAVSLWGL